MLHVKQAAKAFGLDPATLNRYARAGYIAPHLWEWRPDTECRKYARVRYFDPEAVRHIDIPRIGRPSKRADK